MSSRSKSNVAAIILAAGQSTRMGAFKPLLPFGDSTVIEYCIHNFRQAGISNFVVVVGHRAEEIQMQLKDAGVIFATNPDPFSEMSASIAAGVRALPSSAHAVLINPVDHPVVSAEVIDQLAGAWQSGAVAVIPRWNKRGGHPVLVDLSLRTDLLMLDESRGLRAFFETLGTGLVRVAVNSPFIARDMDTWDDYRRLHEDVFGRPPRESGFSGD